MVGRRADETDLEWCDRIIAQFLVFLTYDRYAVGDEVVKECEEALLAVISKKANLLLEQEHDTK